MGKGVATKGGDGEQDGEAGGVAEQDYAQGGGDGSTGMAGRHAA